MDSKFTPFIPKSGLKKKKKKHHNMETSTTLMLRLEMPNTQPVVPSFLYSLCDAPTVARMGVRVDEAGVEYLLGKRSDQFICSLKHKAFDEETFQETSELHVLLLTSFKLSPCPLISSTLLILQPSQNSAVRTLCAPGRGQRERWAALHCTYFLPLGGALTLLVCSQKTLGTTTNLKCFSSSAHLSEFLASFSKSSS